MPVRAALAALAALSLALAASHAAAQGPTFRHMDGGYTFGVHFFDANTGAVAEDGGRIRYWDPAVGEWKQADTPEDVRGQLRGIFFLSKDVAYCVGDGGVVLKSTNFGRNWVQVNLNPVMNLKVPPEPAELYDIVMFDEFNGWACGNDGVLVATANGGQSWSFPSGCTNPMLPGHDPADAYSLYFFPPGATGQRVGLVSLDYGRVWRTENSGCDWVEIDVANSDPFSLCPTPPFQDIELWGIDFSPTDPSYGIVVGGSGVGHGYAFVTNDQGLSFTQMTRFERLPGAPDCTVLVDIAEMYDVAVTGGTDPAAITAAYAGQVFHRQEDELYVDVFDICFCAPDQLVAGGRWLQVEPVGTPDLPAKPPLERVYALDPANVWMSGRFGTIRKMTPDGTDWVDQGTVDYTRLEGGDFVQMATGRVGAAAGQLGRVKRTADDAQSWQTVLDVADGNLFARDLALSSTGRGVALFTGATVYVGSNQALDWALPPAPLPNPPAELHAAAFVPGTDTFYVTGTGGYVARSSDGGATWDESVSASGVTGETLLGVAFADASVGYAVGTSQEVIVTTNGGASWTVLPGSGSVTGEEFRAVAVFDGGNAIYVVGTSGHVWSKTATSGFRPVDLGSAAVSVNLNAVQVLGNGSDVVVGGDAGTVLLYEDGAQWTAPKTHTGEDVKAVDFFSPADGFVLGRQFLVLRYE